MLEAALVLVELVFMVELVFVADATDAVPGTHWLESVRIDY